MCCRLLFGLCLLTLAVTGDAAEILRSGWAVETSVQDGDQPPASYVTLFHGSLVYDVAGSGQEIAVLDTTARHFELLDPQRRLRCLLDGTQILSAMAHIEMRAARIPNEFVKFAANPTFAVHFDVQRKELTLESRPIAYRVQGANLPADRLAAYLDFADWSARLGALHPGGLPAAARIYVNRELRMRQIAPARVSRSLRQKAQSSIAHSDHTYRETLSSEQLIRIAEIDRQRQAFTIVDPGQYLKPLSDPQ